MGELRADSHSSSLLVGDFDTNHYRLQTRIFVKNFPEVLGKLFLGGSLLHVTLLVDSLLQKMARCTGGIEVNRTYLFQRVFFGGDQREVINLQDEEERMGMRLHAHEGAELLFLTRSIVYPNVILL